MSGTSSNGRDTVQLPLFSGFSEPEQLLPTNADALHGMILVSEGERSLEESMEFLDLSPSRLESIQTESGSISTPYREFSRTSDNDNRSLTMSLTLDVQQFDDEAGASWALKLLLQ